MICAGCRRELKEGDLYISDTASGFSDIAFDEDLNDMIAEVLGGKDGKIFYCENCVTDGGEYTFGVVGNSEEKGP